MTTQILLSTKLIAAGTLAEFSHDLLETYIACLEGVRTAWVTLKGEEQAPPRMLACLQREEGEYHIKTASVLPMLLPIEVSRLPQWSDAEPKTYPSTTSEYPLTILPFIARSQCIGHLILRWNALPQKTDIDALFETLTALSPLLYALNREYLFCDLERGKQQWEATFDSMRDPVFISDTQGKLLRVNNALAERLGSTPREVMLKPSKFYKYFGEVVEAYTHSPLWHSHTLDSTFEVTCGQVSDRQKSVIGNVYLLRDITEKVHLEYHIRQNEKLAELGEMVSHIAHELNQRLTSIVGFADMVAKSSLEIPDAMQNRIHKIRGEADRAEMFVKNLLAFGRPNDTEHKPFSLNTVAAKVAELRADSLEEQSIALKLNLADELPLIKGCAHEMEQVLLNMIDNAAHAICHHQNSGSITITTGYSEADTLTMSVTDDGPGILPELLEKIHLPFFTTKRSGEGSGLGLAISHNILRACGATLNVYSEVGQGATFAMEFPIFGKRLQVEEVVEVENESILQTRARAGGTRLRIAVLDDEALIVELLGEMLKDMGHSATLFSSPSCLLEALQSDKYDMILSDVWMPEMSGIELHRHITERYPNLADRVVFLTGDTLLPEIRDVMEKSGCLFLGKPFRQDDLQKVLSTLTERVQVVHRAA